MLAKGLSLNSSTWSAIERRSAVREVFPETKEQRCWFHKIANVLNCLPKSAQPGAKPQSVDW